MTRQWSEIGGSEHELDALTGDLVEMHESTFPAVQAKLAEYGEQLRSATKRSASRRTILLGGLTAAGGVALAACSSTTKSKAVAAPSTSPSAAATYTGDLKVVALAAALENLAVAAYTGALAMAAKGAYGSVPAAVGNFVTVARKQHQEHGAAWNGVLSSAGKPTITTAPLTITAPFVADLKKTNSVASVAKLALDLENTAAQTYLFAEANVTSAAGVATAASIAPVEAMHAAILSFVLGDYPVPNAFLGTSMAVPPADFTG